MKDADVVVIGGGLSGLMSAAVCAAKNKKVTVLSYGAGTFPLNNGVIDILGYDEAGNPVEDALAAVENLPAEHPYKKIGSESIVKSLEFLQKLSEEYGFPYAGDVHQNQWLPTAVGTLKPTCLAPLSMQGNKCRKYDKYLLVGIKKLKDFYVDMVLTNLPEWLGQGKQYEKAEVDLHWDEGRDATTLDFARILDTQEGYNSLAAQLKKYASQDKLLLLPQILGLKDKTVLSRLQQDLQCEIVELTSMPPAANGLRLKEMLLAYLRKHNVRFIEKACVTGAEVENGICKAVVTTNNHRNIRYEADKFILATGGFYSGGLWMKWLGDVKERVFDLPVEMNCSEETWSNPELFSAEKQNFAKAGIRTDENLHPVDRDGNVLLQNVCIVGRNLSNSDFCFEQSGNGIAVSSAYKAALV